MKKIILLLLVMFVLFPVFFAQAEGYSSRIYCSNMNAIVYVYGPDSFVNRIDAEINTINKQAMIPLDARLNDCTSTAMTGINPNTIIGLTNENQVYIQTIFGITKKVPIDCFLPLARVFIELEIKSSFCKK